MIQDYSEVTATLNREVTELINLLNDKKWLQAKKKAHQMDAKLFELMKWIDYMGIVNQEAAK